jgi:hypothetical protein
MARKERPQGVWVPAAFFVVAGLLEIGVGLLPSMPHGFWAVWDVLARGFIHFVVALGLWQRISFFRLVAIVYCLAVLATYAVVFVLAFSNTPAEFSTALVLDSLFEVPSCALLIPYLRSAEASSLFTRPLFGG